MNTNFKCPCSDHDCEYNPTNHDQGCDLCVESSIIDRELPKCFFQKVGGDINTITDWSFEHFSALVSEKSKEKK